MSKGVKISLPDEFMDKLTECARDMGLTPSFLARLYVTNGLRSGEDLMQDIIQEPKQRPQPKPQLEVEQPDEFIPKVQPKVAFFDKHGFFLQVNYISEDECIYEIRYAPGIPPKEPHMCPICGLSVDPDDYRILTPRIAYNSGAKRGGTWNCILCGAKGRW